jgi:alkanesulfonate monooxygenase SsuD/methylene tetrahydromethanopterin reductase-like flavin-dependent oxidoreductase (luciferase family)
MLDEGLAVLAGLWSGEPFNYAGQHYTVDPVRFTPVPVQRPPDGFDVAVWAEVAPEPAAVPSLAAPYQAAGATWWIETAKPEPRWWEGITARVGAGVLGGA